MARVRAEHGFEKFFVLKFILAEAARSAAERAMFLDEARISARISHPNVAQTIELGEIGGLLYLVMERVEGDSLSSLIGRMDGSDIPTGVSLRLLADVCDGLHAAHELCDANGRPMGLVHRDVSPQNILVSMTGHAKLIDFGVAKAAARLAAVTSRSTVKGKLAYVAPEQAQAVSDLDCRADLWAIGVVLFRLLTGHLPIEADSDAAILNKLLSVRRPPALPPGSPDALSHIIEKTLAPAREDRFATALDLKQALEQALASIAPGTSHESVAAFFQPALVDAAVAQSQALAAAEAGLAGRDHAGELGARTQPGDVSLTDASDRATERRWPARPVTVLALAALALAAMTAVIRVATRADTDPAAAKAPGQTSRVDPIPTAGTTLPPAALPLAAPPKVSSSVATSQASGAPIDHSTGGRRPGKLPARDAVSRREDRKISDSSPKALNNPYP